MLLTENELFTLQKKFSLSISDFEFPGEDEFLSFLDESINSLENENSSYRPRNSEENCGGLLDFSLETKPVIVVPDLHGRTDFLIEVLNFNLENLIGEKISVLTALNKSLVKIVCVGDGVHAESRAAERWQKAFSDYTNGIFDGEAMREEMKENISTMMIVMELKNLFTEDFHFLKGNHENVLNENSHGNFSFRKFVLEGSMCYKFLQHFYGDAVLHLISIWEKSLPLFALFKNFCISHAEPAKVFTREQIVNAAKYDDVVSGLTWTANSDVSSNTCWETFRKLMGKKNSESQKENFFYIGGHRPVKENYDLRQNGTYIQIHNPNKKNVAFCVPGKKFNPETDIFCVLQNE